MESHRFDLMARTLHGGSSRRQTLKRLAAVAFAPLFALAGVRDAAAGCGGCPPSKPCCIKNKCRPRCGGTCCLECFIEIPLVGEPDPADAFCCTAAKGKVCGGSNRSRRDDRCCYSDELCLNGRCCGNKILGMTRCGRRCCPQAACCKGKKGRICCRPGTVCLKTPGIKKQRCVAANRGCLGDTDCFPGEVCHGGTCCSGNRICQDLVTNDPVCCKDREYCEFQGSPAERCAPVNTSTSTYRGQRVRP